MGESSNSSRATIEVRTKCFVIQPFGKRTHPKTNIVTDNDKVYNALRELEDIIPSLPIRISRADIGRIREDDLHDHVIAKLKDADFCIADLTGQNPNVLYEAGVAKGIGLPIILITQNRSDIPTDLKKYIVVRYSQDDLQNIAADIAQHLDVIQGAIRDRRIALQARVEYFKTRNEAGIREWIAKADHTIDILQTNLSTIQNDYLQQILERMRDNVSLKLRILTLNPQSIFVNFRGAQIGFRDNIGLYRDELDATIRSVHFALREFGERVEIRVYDDFPTQIVFFFDSDILACVVSATGRSRENCAFRLDAQLPGADRSFIKHFKYLWKENSREYPLED